MAQARWRAAVAMSLAAAIGCAVGPGDRAPAGTRGGEEQTGGHDGRAGKDGDPGPQSKPRDVILVANSVSGTVSVVDSSTLANLGSIDVIPDRVQRVDEI